MPAERYFLEGSFQLHESQELTGSEFHHLAHVMRTRKGEHVELVNGQGALAQAIVDNLKKDKAILTIERVDQEKKSPCRLILAQAFPKPNRLEFILEKGTELGVDAFWLFPGHHSMKKDCYPSQIERARTITIAAMKQCGRLYLPSICVQPPIDQWEAFTQTAFFGDLDPIAPLFEVAWRQLNSPSYPIVFMTGPEGGFSSQEERTLTHLGAIGVKLHANVLRTETASIMALSLLSHWLTSRET